MIRRDIGQNKRLRDLNVCRVFSWNIPLHADICLVIVENDAYLFASVVPLYFRVRLVVDILRLQQDSLLVFIEPEYANCSDD